MKTAMSASMVAFGVALSASTGLAEELNVVCSNEQAWCDLMAQNFEIETGIDVAIVRKSTGEVLAQLRAEKGIRRSMSGGAVRAIRISSLPMRD